MNSRVESLIACLAVVLLAVASLPMRISRLVILNALRGLVMVCGWLVVGLALITILAPEWSQILPELTSWVEARIATLSPAFRVAIAACAALLALVPSSAILEAASDILRRKNRRSPKVNQHMEDCIVAGEAIGTPSPPVSPEEIRRAQRQLLRTSGQPSLTRV